MVRRAFLSLLTSTILCLNLTSVASAINRPNLYARQAGIISVDPVDRYNVGVRSHFTVSTYQTPAVDGAHQFFWVAESLSDGTFYQAGITACGSQCLEWFAQAFDRNGTLILNWPGCPSCYPTTPGYHDVAIQRGQMGQVYYWYPTFDDVRYQNSEIWVNAPDSGPGTPPANPPEVFAELSLHPQGPMPNPNSQLGPLTATDYGTGVKAHQTRFPVPGGGFAGMTPFTRMHSSSNQVCPPINVYGCGYQSALGNFTGHACAVDYNRLGNW